MMPPPCAFTRSPAVSSSVTPVARAPEIVPTGPDRQPPALLPPSPPLAGEPPRATAPPPPATPPSIPASPPDEKPAVVAAPLAPPIGPTPVVPAVADTAPEL